MKTKMTGAKLAKRFDTLSDEFKAKSEFKELFDIMK